LLDAFARPGTYARLRPLAESGALLATIPELRPLVGCTQPKEHYYDVFEHTLHTVAYAEQAAVEDGPAPLFPPHLDRAAYFAERIGTRSRLELLKWAALFHDIAKPQTRSVQANGRIRFFGHSELGAEISEGVLDRLGFGAEERAHVAAMVLHHLRPGQMGETWPPTERAVHRFFRELGDAGIDTLILNLADHCAARGPRMRQGEWQAHVARIRALIAFEYPAEPRRAPVRLITGEDVMRELGIGPGPQVGGVLRQIQEEAPETREEALYLLRQLAAGTATQVSTVTR
jgi:poly(A) polymerase